MQGKLHQRRRLPPVLRVFAPTRLTEELLAGAYERLLGAGDRSDPLPAVSPYADPQGSYLSEDPALTTGGQS